MKALIDNLLDRVTMYQLMLYYLIALLGGAMLLGAFGLAPLRPAEIGVGAVLAIGFSYLFNWFFATLFHAKRNPESQYITALILALIIGPVSIYTNGALALVVATAVAAGSKYIIAHERMHVFNPAALGAFVAALILGQGASWWIGFVYIIPLLVFGGLLVVYKLQRLKMVGLFFATFLFAIASMTAIVSQSSNAALQIFVYPSAFAPVLFFAFVMLVEPLTSPQQQRTQYFYAILVAILAALYSYSDLTGPYALELALLSGNIFTRAVAFNPRVRLVLREREMVARDTISFWFEPSHPVAFVPGQFMQWELPHHHADDRGVRRFFTICSSPTESRIMFTTKFSKPSSTFKSTLYALLPPDAMTGMGVGGTFTLPPSNDATPCVFIAGGIGITPFRSMIKYMVDQKLSRPITLLYSNKSVDDIAFKSLFDEAGLIGWLKTVYTITDTIPYGWRGRTGFITAAMIAEEVPDYRERLFYISGPQPMVNAFVPLLSGMGIPREHIRTDYFPGYTETHQAKKDMQNAIK